MVCTLLQSIDKCWSSRCGNISYLGLSFFEMALSPACQRSPIATFQSPDRTSSTSDESVFLRDVFAPACATATASISIVSSDCSDDSTESASPVLARVPDAVPVPAAVPLMTFAAATVRRRRRSASRAPPAPPAPHSPAATCPRQGRDGRAGRRRPRGCGEALCGEATGIARVVACALLVSELGARCAANTAMMAVRPLRHAFSGPLFAGELVLRRGLLLVGRAALCLGASPQQACRALALAACAPAALCYLCARSACVAARVLLCDAPACACCAAGLLCCSGAELCACDAPAALCSLPERFTRCAARTLLRDARRLLGAEPSAPRPRCCADGS